MGDAVYELLAPYFESDPSRPPPSPDEPTISAYLDRLSTLSLSALSSTEPQSLTHASQTNLRSLQALSKRSRKAVIASTDHLSSLGTTLPRLASAGGELRNGLPELKDGASRFAQKYGSSVDNPAPERRREAILLARNVDRISDILDLPSLLSTAISTSAGYTQSSNAAMATSYASALDLHAHIKRLHNLYPTSKLVSSIAAQADDAMRSMTTNLITSLRSQGIKLAGAMRIVGWLRRLAPELEDTKDAQRSLNVSSSEGSLGALFLTCRLTNLLSTLEALEPLRELADQESRQSTHNSKGFTHGRKDESATLNGQQTEKYLKRYIEIFREQSFAIISMYKNIFPSALPRPEPVTSQEDAPSNLNSPHLRSLRDQVDGNGVRADDPLLPLPSALSTCSLHLVELLTDTLKHYLPNVQDRGARDSLLTQILYCAGSLGRLGGDFGMMLALLDDDAKEDEGVTETHSSEWIEAMKKHRIQASRLELLASGVGSGRKHSINVTDLPQP